MAKYSDAVDRLTYLLFGTPYRATPTTLSGDARGVKSYDLLIVQHLQTGHPKGTYLVHQRNSTLTTNRHIDAANMLFTDLGWQAAGRTPDGWNVYIWPDTDTAADNPGGLLAQCLRETSEQF